MARLDMSEIVRDIESQLERILTSPDLLARVLSSAVHVIRPGDTVLMRFGRHISGQEEFEIRRAMRPVAVKGGFEIAIADCCDEIRVIRKEEGQDGEPTQPPHAAPQDDAQSVPEQSPASPDTRADYLGTYGRARRD
jgi:hypothetical protein